MLETGVVTNMGKLLARFPINPRFSKMLVVAKFQSVLPLAISLVCILVDKSPFMMSGDRGGFDNNDGNASNDSEGDRDDEDDQDDYENDNPKNKKLRQENSEDKRMKDARLNLRKHQFGDAFARLISIHLSLHLSLSISFLCTNYCHRYRPN